MITHPDSHSRLNRSRGSAALLGKSMLLATLTLPWAVGAATVVAPNALEVVEGNFNNAFPFTSTLFASMRYQQVYGAGEFSSVPGPFYVTGMTFRLDGVQTVAWSGTTPGMSSQTTPASIGMPIPNGVFRFAPAASGHGERHAISLGRSRGEEGNGELNRTFQKLFSAGYRAGRRASR